MSVCVVGAGLSGLTGVKCMIDAGFNVTCLEKDLNIAGRWHKNSSSTIPRSTITNLPSFYSCFSDFPIPDNFPIYLQAERFCEYFELYAKHFDLYKHIKLGCNVISVKPLLRVSKDSLSEESYRWSVTYEIGEQPTKYVEEFDFLVISSGFYCKPYIPEQIENVLKDFEGKVVHSINYKDWKEFENQNVVVCGLGNTGGDVVSDVADHCKQAYVSTSKGAHVIGRFTQGGTIPIAKSAMRILQYIPTLITSKLSQIGVRRFANSVYNLDDLHLTPKSIGSFIINDEICIRIASGKVKVKPSIRKTSGNTVYFSNGTTAENVDSVILCTGYQRSFAFFENGVLDIQKNGKYIPLYKQIFTSKYGKSLAFFGMYSVPGSVVAMAEIQSRYAAEVFKGAVSLPSKKEMEKSIVANEKDAEAFHGSEMKEYNFISNPWTYADDLASSIGCRPSITYLLCTDPYLAWYLIVEYSIHEYRLFGPNKWSGARDAIINKKSKMFSFMNGSRELLK